MRNTNNRFQKSFLDRRGGGGAPARRRAAEGTEPPPPLPPAQSDEGIATGRRNATTRPDIPTARGNGNKPGRG